MSRAIRCKRIINGKTYNTETSTRLAGWSESPDQYPVSFGEDLYQNRLGAFFVYEWGDDSPDGPYQDLKPLTPEEAGQWLQKHRPHDVDLYESLFGQQPEAGSGESKFTLRLPDHLRDRLAARAKANGQSLNAWMVRCLEKCASDEESAPQKPRRKTRFI